MIIQWIQSSGWDTGWTWFATRHTDELTHASTWGREQFGKACEDILWSKEYIFLSAGLDKSDYQFINPLSIWGHLFKPCKFGQKGLCRVTCDGTQTLLYLNWSHCDPISLWTTRMSGMLRANRTPVQTKNTNQDSSRIDHLVLKVCPLKHYE